MDAWRYLCRRLWVVALVLMAAYVTVDTIIHLATTYSVSTEHLYLPPAADLSSPTGYALGQRDEILPYVGMDGYHWVMQTQDMLAKGEARVRWVDYDNYHTPQITAPEKEPGREVHWSSSFRWWVALLAWTERTFGGVALPYAVEDVVPFANTMLIVLMVILLAPTLARRFGSGLTALTVFGMGAIGPLYESFSEGKSDHHGLASLSALLTVLFLLGGAAGWVRTDGGAAALSPGRAWMPSRWQALGGMILAGLVFCVGLWLVSGGKSPSLAAVLLTIAFLNLVLTLFLWIRTSIRPNEAADTQPLVENIPDATPPSGKNATPTFFAWLPTPGNMSASVLFLGSVFTIFCGLLYYYLISDPASIVNLLPITHTSALLSWAWRAPMLAVQTLPTLTCCLFGLAGVNILVALFILFKQPFALPKDKSAKTAKVEEPVGSRLLAWLPNRAQARQWFIASGVAGGVGLWVSTASEAPVLAEIGLGALLATGLFARGTSPQSWAKADPSLWRVWGWSGAATSIFFYLLEYFPSHLGMRLEVNHPLYAFAWAGGGEILFRLSRWWADGKLAENPRDWAWLAGSAFAVLIVPLIIFVFADQVFWIASWTDNSRFLFIFHEDYIAEFKDMRRYLDTMYSGGSGRYAFAVINPLILLAVPMLAWLCKYSRQVLFGVLAVGILLYDIFLLAFHSYLFSQKDFPLDYYTWPMLAIPLCACVFLLWLWEPWPDFPRPCKALIGLSLPGGLLTMFLSLREMRWMEIGYAIWLPALVGAALALWLHPGYRWSVARKTALGIFLACVLLPSPVLTVMDWVRWNWTAPMSDVEIMEIVTRDASQRLRARIGNDTGVVVSGPTTTTWMSYWGGFKGLGTLYWENLDGLKADMAIYSAKTPEEALTLIKKYGVTHIAIFSWDPFYKEYARLSQNMHRPIVDSEYAAEAPLRGWMHVLTKPSGQVDPAAAEIPKIQDAFVYSLIERAVVPTWLRPIYYPMPGDPNLRGQYVIIYEVVPNQSAKEQAVRIAQAELAQGTTPGIQAALNNVNAALKLDPSYLPAL
ncbi:MAG TPA: hypothetical protein VK737_05470, partial [Opitutales bacterium]|nr:hypothetical protein [Opitutales bacterium]